MDGSILRLYPLPSEEVPLEGLYLSHGLRQLGLASGRPFVYANFLTSLDGRIAIPHPTRPGMVIPEQVANRRDWRLFQELAVQADLHITTGRYLRDYADGRAQEILRVHEEPQFADLKDWREAHELVPLPDLAVISASLDFPIPEPLTRGERSILIYTAQSADPERVRSLEDHAGRVIFAGEDKVDGRRLVENLADLGYRTVYSTAGPQVLHLLLAAGVLDRLYLTHASRIFGGRPYSSIVEGELLASPVDFRLNTLDYDPVALDGLGQLFTSYDRQSGKVCTHSASSTSFLARKLIPNVPKLVALDD